MATSKVTTEFVTVTPELAEEWLGHNSHNRAIRNRTVTKLANAIKRGEWKVNGDSIRFAKDGSLQDGQHRLWAVVEADQAVETLVIKGLDPEAQETMDQGERRNLKDALKLRGYPAAVALAASLNYLFRVLNGQVRDTGVRPTVAQGIALLGEHPTITDAVKTATKFQKRFHLSQAMLATVIYTFDSVDPDACEVFVDKLISAVELEEHSPILVLRHYLEARESSASGARSSAVVTHALFIKAWNAYREGRLVDRLSWKAAGSHAESFPEPV